MLKWFNFCFLFLISLQLSAQHQLQGKVQHALTLNALADADVQLVQQGKLIQRAQSNADGVFVFSKLKPGNYTVLLTLHQFKKEQVSVSVGSSPSQLINISLQPLSLIADEVLVRSTRMQKDAPGTFTNLTHQEISKQNLGQDMPSLLNLTPNVVINSDAGAGIGYTGIRIRGVDPTRTNVTINGIPLNDAESHGMFWVNTPDFASSTQSIQIQRGAGTSTNGAAAFGASVNLQTDVVAEKPYSEISSTLGSFNTRRLMLRAGTGIMDNGWSVDARLSLIKSDGFIDRSFSDLKSYFVSAARYGKKSTLKINQFSGKEQTYQAWNGVPEARLKGDFAGMQQLASDLWMSPADYALLLSSGNRTYNSFTYKNQTDNYQQDHFQAFYTYQTGKNSSWNTGLHYTYGRGYYEEFRPDEKFSKYKLANPVFGSDTLTSGDFVRQRWLDNDFYGLVSSWNLEKPDFNLVVGTGIHRYDGRHFGKLVWSSVGTLSDLEKNFYEGKSAKTDFNIYAKVNKKFGAKWQTFLDLQFRTIAYTLKGEDLDGSTYRPYDFNLNYNFFNPKAGVSYLLNPKAQVYAYVGVAGKEPIRNDIIQASGSSIPKPEHMYNGELGYKLTGRNQAFTANTYLMYYKDQLVATGEINDVGAYNRVNVPKSYRAGIELAYALRVSNRLTWSSNLSWSRNRIVEFTEFVDDWDLGTQVQTKYKSSPIAFSPDWVGGSSLSYAWFPGFTTELISKYVSRQFLDNTGNKARSLDGFFVNDVRVAWEKKMPFWFESVRITLQVNNLLSEKYEPNGYTFSGIIGGTRRDFNYYFPQAGRNYLLNLNLKF